ncbi:MAG: 50S ribosomal protein L18 [Acidobacteria bacterium]|nr:50S ribosomal protein L18 [Acidobacteriota bacterium]
MKIKTKHDRRHRIQLRTRKRVQGTTQRPRLSVFRSVEHIYVQAIDDATGRTMAAASSVEPTTRAAFAAGAKGGNLKGATVVGKAIAERLQAQGIKHVVFDRSGFLYHGRVRAVAEAAREAGLEF